MENEVKNSFRSGYPKGIAFGMALMFIGVVFLGSNVGLIPLPMKNVIISWQMLLIFIGVVNLFKRKFIPGIIWFIIGSFLMVLKVFLLLRNNLNKNFGH